MDRALKILLTWVFLSIAVPLMLVGFLVAAVVRGIKAGDRMWDDLMKYIR